MNAKICSSCQLEKSLENYYKCKANKTGFNSSCKSCMDKRSKEWIDNNKEKRKNVIKSYYENNKEEHSL